MPNLDLNIAFWDYDRTRPLMDERVRPEGINPNITVLRPREIFPRMLQDQEFHAADAGPPAAQLRATVNRQR